MALLRLTERIWYFPCEDERDRPNLGYIRGDRWSLAVDAGHSQAHVREFYADLEAAGLPLPALTVLTHWHWDHTCGIHAVHGLTLARARTNAHLEELRDLAANQGEEAFFSIDASIRLEYAGGQEVVIRPADLAFEGEITLDAGNCPVRVLAADAPHTDDSALIYVPGEKVLFLGDAPCEVFQTREKDPKLCQALAAAIRATGAETCLEGHWQPLGVRETLEDMTGN